jgi:lipopolysaccharide biosynthesis protein
MHGSSPKLFRRQLRLALRLIADVPFEQRILFIRSWNEWAEGNHLEPDLRFGHGFLEAVREELRAPRPS